MPAAWDGSADTSWYNTTDNTFTLTDAADLAGFAALGYSLTYNVLFLLPDTLIAVAVAAVLLCNKAFNAIVASTFNGKNKADGSAKNDEGTAARTDER